MTLASSTSLTSFHANAAVLASMISSSPWSTLNTQPLAWASFNNFNAAIIKTSYLLAATAASCLAANQPICEHQGLVRLSASPFLKAALPCRHSMYSCLVISRVFSLQATYGPPDIGCQAFI